MSQQPVLLDVRDRIATITLNRPEARNALSRELLPMLPEGIQQAEALPAAVVLGLTGPDLPCAGGPEPNEVAAGGLSHTESEVSLHRRVAGRAQPLNRAVRDGELAGGFEQA